jgi:DNA polymerase-3 subunit gamma/tau
LVPEEKKTENKDFTPESLKAAWMRFAETKKAYQAEYHLLTQPVELNGPTVILPLHHPVQETLLHGLRSDLLAYLRAQLNNHSIQVIGEMQAMEEKKILYTNREKFEFMANKNPALRELKDRLGLDTDF